MTPATDLQHARDIAKPGQWIMTKPVSCANPLWCVMDEAEVMLFSNISWIQWERK